MTVRISKPEFNLREKLIELDKPTGLKGSELMKSENTQDVRDIVHADRKNILINGAMEVCQRDATKTGITANGYYCCDRWHLQLHGPTVSLAQDSDNPGHGFNKSLALTVTTAVGSLAAGNSLKLRYMIEGYDVARLQYGTKYAKPFTLSFWVKSSLTGQFAISFTRDSRIVNRQVTVNSANTWEHKSITILGDYTTALSNTTNGTGMILQMFPSSGANSTDGANIPVWNSFHNAHTAYGANMGHLLTTNSVFKITGLQMEIGTQHTDFEHRRYAHELELCERYYEVHWQNTNANNPAGSHNDGYNSVAAGVNLGSYSYFPFKYRTQKRAGPAISYSGKFRIIGGGSGNNKVPDEFYSPSIDGCRIRVAGSGTSGQASVLEFDGVNSNTGYIAVNAEL